MNTTRFIFLMLLTTLLMGCSNDEDDIWTREFTNKNIESVLNGHWEMTGSRKLTSNTDFTPDNNGSADFNVPNVTFKINKNTYTTTLSTPAEYSIVTADNQFIIKLTESRDEIEVLSRLNMKDMLFKRK